MKTIINTNAAPAPIGPYSQAVKAGNLLFVSGQIALDGRTGQMIQTSITAETEKVMMNLAAILEAAGLPFGNIIKTTIFLKNMDDFPVVNEVYAKYFSDNFPARETVEVSRLPKGANVEISIVVSTDQ